MDLSMYILSYCFPSPYFHQKKNMEIFEQQTAKDEPIKSINDPEICLLFTEMLQLPENKNHQQASS